MTILFWLAKLRIHYTQKTLRPYLLDSAGALLDALQFAAWLAVSFALADGVMRLLSKTAWTAETKDGVYFAALLCSCGLGWLVGRKIKRNIEYSEEKMNACVAAIRRSRIGTCCPRVLCTKVA